jgi:flagellar biosynthetic protein FlhB
MAITETPCYSKLTAGQPYSVVNSCYFDSAANIHLQWFSDDDNEAQGRTIEPTEPKLRRLREEGEVPKSQELVSALGLLLPAVLLLFFAPSMLKTCTEMLRFFLLRAVELNPVQDRVIALVFFRYLVRLVWPILAVAMVSGILSNVIQTNGLLFTTKPITPDFTRVIPRIGQFFKRIFSIDGVWNFGKALIKMVIIGAVAFVIIRSELPKLANFQKANPYIGLTSVASLAIRMLLICALLMLILSIPDIFFQRWRFRERHKMSRQEVKEESRQYEADPTIQGRIRRRFQDLLRQNISVAVPRSSVVITNPTHLAVALEYHFGMTGPRVNALGADEIAAQIRRIAQENGVPIVEDKPLAQALYKDARVGDLIPENYITAVAYVLSKVWHINELRESARGGLSA